MFTGIIEEKGKILSIKKAPKSILIKVEAKNIFDDLKIGDSVSSNGVCLTVTQISGNTFSADVMNETVKRTNLKDLRTGDFINLERALTLSTRLGGHMVSGHIDGTGTITNIKKEDIAFVYTIKTSREITRYIIQKGSVAIDGISLTVVDVNEESFRLSIIPHTMENTILMDKGVGDTVNIENDLMAKYIEKLVLNKDDSELYNKKSKDEKISLSFLLENGF